MKRDYTILFLIAIIFLYLLLVFFFIYYFLFYKSPYTEKEISSTSEEKNLINSSKIFKENGIVTNIWVSKEDLDKIKKHNIKYLFVDIGDTSLDGTIKTSQNEIEQFLEMISLYETKNDYNFIILPYSEINTNNYFIDDTFEINFINDYRTLLSKGFDGVYVDIEPVKDETKFLFFLEKLKDSFPHKIIGVYSGGVGNHNSNEWEWDLEYFTQVSKFSDIIVIPGYDTDIDNTKDYYTHITNQIKSINSLFIKNNTEIYYGIPSHKKSPELINNTLFIYSSNKSHKNGKFNGVVVFAEWTMDEEEWDIFRKIVLSN